MQEVCRDPQTPTISHLNTTFNNPSGTLRYVTVVAPTHPLFGRSFPVRYSRPTRDGQSHVWAVYDEKGVYLRLPLAATDACSPTPSLQTKLNAPAVAELITLAQQYRLPCPLSPQPSGDTSPQNASKPSSMS